MGLELFNKKTGKNYRTRKGPISKEEYRTMKRSLRLTLTLIAVLVLAMSVMVISAGAADAPAPPLTASTMVDGVGITVVSPGVYSHTYASNSTLNVGDTYNPTVTVETVTDYKFGADADPLTPITVSLNTTFGGSGVQGTITIPWKYVGTNPSIDGSKTGNITIAVTRNVNDTASFSIQAPVETVVGDTMTFTATTATNVNLAQYIDKSI